MARPYDLLVYKLGASSIGLKSGLYGGRNLRWAPTASIAVRLGLVVGPRWRMSRVPTYLPLQWVLILIRLARAGDPVSST